VAPTSSSSRPARTSPRCPVSSLSAGGGSHRSQRERQPQGTKPLPAGASISCAAPAAAVLTSMPLTSDLSSRRPPREGTAALAGPSGQVQLPPDLPSHPPGTASSAGPARSRTPVTASRSRSLSPGLVSRFRRPPGGLLQSLTPHPASPSPPVDDQAATADRSSAPGEPPSVDDDGFTLVVSRRKRREGPGEGQPLPKEPSLSPSTSAAPTGLSGNRPPLDSRPSAAPRRPLPSVGVARPPPISSALPAFRIPPQEGYQTSYDAVAELERLHPALHMRNLAGRDNSCVVVPLDEATHQQLCALAEDLTFPVRLVALDPGATLTKGVVMGYPLGMPTDLLLRHPQVEEATRCCAPRTRDETRQVIVSVRGPLPPHLDLGNWGLYYLRPYSPEPLRCFRCQRFGHHQASCDRPQVCGMCSGPHQTEGCLAKYKARQEVQPRCPNCSQAHHAWNKTCPARLRRVHQGRVNQVNWVTQQQTTASRPAPLGTFVWGQQVTQTPAAPSPPKPAEFPPLPPHSQAVTAPSPGAPQSTVTASSDQSPALAPLSLPPGTLLMTKSLLTDFAKELALGVASTFQQLVGVDIDMKALESAVERIADRVSDQVVDKARALTAAHQQHILTSTLKAPPSRSTDVLSPHGPEGVQAPDVGVCPPAKGTPQQGAELGRDSGSCPGIAAVSGPSTLPC